MPDLSKRSWLTEINEDLNLKMRGGIRNRASLIRKVQERLEIMEAKAVSQRP